MDDARSVRAVQGATDLNRACQDVVDRERTLSKAIGQRYALEVLHDQERGPAILADVVERADVRMVQPGDRAGFAMDPRAELRVSRQCGREDLDGDRTVEASVARLVNLAHATGADRGGDLKGTQSLSGREYAGALLHECAVAVVSASAGRQAGLIANAFVMLTSARRHDCSSGHAGL